MWLIDTQLNTNKTHTNKMKNKPQNVGQGKFIVTDDRCRCMVHYTVYINLLTSYKS